MWDYFPEDSEHWDLESIAKGDLWEELKKFSKSPKGRLLADKLQTDLLISSNRLTALTATTDEYISNEFLGSISAFVEATK